MSTCCGLPGILRSELGWAGADSNLGRSNKPLQSWARSVSVSDRLSPNFQLTSIDTGLSIFPLPYQMVPFYNVFSRLTIFAIVLVHIALLRSYLFPVWPVHVIETGVGVW